MSRESPLTAGLQAEAPVYRSEIAAGDISLDGQEIKKGDRAARFLGAASRDRAVLIKGAPCGDRGLFRTGL